MATRRSVCPAGLRLRQPFGSAQDKRSFASRPQTSQHISREQGSRHASTSSSDTDWVSWIRKASALRLGNGSDAGGRGKALLFAGLGSYPHTPHSATSSSIHIWERASEALLEPDATIGYWPKGMEEFAGGLRGGRGLRGWMRGWVEGRSLDELMARADVTAAFILSSSIAILASAQETSGSSSLLPPYTTHLAGHGFIGTLTALVAAGRLDLATGVRLARIYASLPTRPTTPTPSSNPRFLTTVLSARHFHSLSSPSTGVPFADPFSDDTVGIRRRRAMQLILDEVHELQSEWEQEGEEWAEAGVINSSKVLIVTGTQEAVVQIVERLQQLSLANPVMDVHMPCPYNTRLMEHAVPNFREVLGRCSLDTPSPVLASDFPIILDPITTHPIEDAASALLSHLTHQLRWHKTLRQLYDSPVPQIGSFLTVGRGAKGLGVMLRGELKTRPDGAAAIGVGEFGVRESGLRARA